MNMNKRLLSDACSAHNIQQINNEDIPREIHPKKSGVFKRSDEE